MDRTAPRSTVVDITWRPCLAFYEQGVPLLRKFEDAGLLRRFRVGEHVVEAQLRDGTRLAVTVTGMSVIGTGRQLPIHQACGWIHEVAEALQPADINVNFFIQCLRALELDITYPAACRRATAAWTPGLAALGIYDTATLVDGLSLHGDLRYQAEFGIVDAEQAPERLARSLGNRIGGPELHLTPGDEYPPLAVFVDSSWFPQGAPADADNLAQWVLPVLDQATTEAQDLTNALHAMCVDGPDTEDGGESRDRRSAAQVRARG